MLQLTIINTDINTRNTQFLFRLRDERIFGESLSCTVPVPWMHGCMDVYVVRSIITIWHLGWCSLVGMSCCCSKFIYSLSIYLCVSIFQYQQYTGLVLVHFPYLFNTPHRLSTPDLILVLYCVYSLWFF